jgi:hypothetical protein
MGVRFSCQAGLCCGGCGPTSQKLSESSCAATGPCLLLFNKQQQRQQQQIVPTAPAQSVNAKGDGLIGCCPCTAPYCCC